MKKQFRDSEEYPVYIPDEHDVGEEIEITPEEWDRYQKARAEWDAVQALVGDRVDAAFIRKGLAMYPGKPPTSDRTA